jgi:hypothetical protein
MICYALQLAHFPISMLEHGSRMNELNVNPNCQISDWRLAAMHDGMDASINSLLTGGSGFPAIRLFDPEIENAFDFGCRQEQRDLVTLHNA